MYHYTMYLVWHKHIDVGFKKYACKAWHDIISHEFCCVASWVACARTRGNMYGKGHFFPT